LRPRLAKREHTGQEQQPALGQARRITCDVKKTHTASGRNSIGAAAAPQSYSPAKRCVGLFGITVAFVFLKIWLAKAASKNSLCSSPVL
jgi:hypothetical protein